MPLVAVAAAVRIHTPAARQAARDFRDAALILTAVSVADNRRMASPPAQSDPVTRLTQAVGAVVGAVGVASVMGALSLSLRYASFGLYGQPTAALTPREDLLGVALATLAVWLLVGAVLLAVIAGWTRGW